MYDDLFNKLKKTNEFITKEQIYALYDQVSKEIESGMKDNGVWTKAYADARGDLQMQKALYIEMMVEKYALASAAEEEVSKQKKKEKEIVELEKKQEREKGAFTLLILLFLPAIYLAINIHGYDDFVQRGWGAFWISLIAVFISLGFCVYVIESSYPVFALNTFLKLLALSILTYFFCAITFLISALVAVHFFDVDFAEWNGINILLLITCFGVSFYVALDLVTRFYNKKKSRFIP